MRNPFRIKNVLNCRHPALWLIVTGAVLAVVAAVCLNTGPVAVVPPDIPNVPNTPPDEGLNALLDPWMKEILGGERTFTTTYATITDKAYTIHDLESLFYGDEQNFDTVVKAEKFAIIDLDLDGINEMVVGTERDFLGYLILRCKEDVVYGYTPGYRSFEGIKADGTFHWSGGTGYHGIGSAQFTENGFELKQTIWCEVLSADNSAYFVDGRNATQAEFDAAIAAQHTKPALVWYAIDSFNTTAQQ